MKAVRIHDYGGPEALCYEDAPIPEPRPRDVLVRVHAAGVNPADRQIRAGLRFRLEKPFAFIEYECGHWYARAMASDGLLQAFSGAFYDAVTHTLFLAPPQEGDFRAFLCTATGYATVGVRGDQPFCEAVSGTVPVQRIDYKEHRHERSRARSHRQHGGGGCNRTKPPGHFVLELWVVEHGASRYLQRPRTAHGGNG